MLVVGAAAALAIGRVPHVPNHQLHKLHLAKPELVADRGRDEGVADGAELGVGPGPGEVWGFGFWCGRRTDLAGRRIIVFLAILSGASSRLALPTWRRPTTACAGRRSIRRSMAGGRVGTGPGVGGAGQGPGGWAVDGRRAGPSSLLWWRPGLFWPRRAGWVDCGGVSCEKVLERTGGVGLGMPDGPRKVERNVFDFEGSANQS